MEVTNQPIPVIDDEALAEIGATAEALKGVPDACDITHAKPEFVDYVLKCNPAAISALCRTLRAALQKHELDEHALQEFRRIAENEITRLRELLAEVELARDQLSSALSVRDTQLSELRKQLAQVEKERDNMREFDARIVAAKIADLADIDISELNWDELEAIPDAIRNGRQL